MPDAALAEDCAMKLYDYQLAPNPRRVRIFVAEKGITVPIVQVDLCRGDQFTPEFRSINPECTVPVLEFNDGRRLTEVIAICLYFGAVAELVYHRWHDTYRTTTLTGVMAPY